MSKSAVLLVLVALTVNVNGECGYPPYYDYTILREEYQAHSPSEFIEGFKVAYYCQSGYARTAGSASITCINKMWSTLTLKCELVKCPDPPSIVNGEITNRPQGTVTFGTSITYKCNEGILVGNRELVCTKYGNYSSAPPACKGRSCGSPGEILNGHFNTDEGVLFGDKAYAVCDEGFQVAGIGVRSCRAAGWDGTIPICEIVKCPDPPSIVNGEITNPPQGTVTFGTSITYKCNEGVLVGNRELVCTKYGNYSSAPPACKDHKGCPSVQVANGYKIAGFGPVYNYGDFIAFACNPGYILKGPDSVTCGINETWEPELPTCQKGKYHSRFEIKH
ncbi:complement receptor type 2-like isoform X1 [Acipenser oxyrinchus oxyrinchus]|uniref:Complement receptor type 2-like isoform X1 n=1 Tax=Acipenser oxyrinchus oxyrinchus TaxID=40147 RepID=A0AAD8FQF0_ACIOX|nr:complement receptor type 2-like isoform X1 [Acipenser oxyrinchus oxyrinchus]